jgi:hypothetical protein
MLASRFLIGKSATMRLNVKRPPFVINNPSALVGALPILLEMISDDWYVAWGSKEHTRSLGTSLMRQHDNVLGHLFIIDGTTLSIMIYKVYVPILILRFSNTHSSTHPLNHTS